MAVVNHFFSIGFSSEMKIAHHRNRVQMQTRPSVPSLDIEVHCFKHFLLQNDTVRFIFLAVFSAMNLFMLVCRDCPMPTWQDQWWATHQNPVSPSTH